uniref:Replication protein A subunit n=1 Tax=Tetranychus urticae TaxID=32264 RepID=T1K7Y7_TETUR
MTCPIAGLNPLKRNWKICGKIVAKSEIKTWSNSNSNGQFFNFVIADSSSYIKSIAFNQQCEKLFPKIKLNAVYFVANGTIKETKKQYMELNNPYEIHLHSNADVTLTDCNVEEPEYIYKKIADLENVQSNELINVKAIIKHIDNLEEYGAEKKNYKRDIELMDDTESTIKLTIWNEQAMKFSYSEGSVILGKRLKISNYNGKNLLALDISYIEIDPEIPEKSILKQWFFNKRSKIAQNCLTLEPTMVDLMTLKTINVASNVHCEATIVSVKSCTFYFSCPDGCNKKLIEDDSGLLECSTCAKVMMDGNQKLVLKVKIVDFIGTIETTIYSEIAEKLLDCKCETLSELEMEGKSNFEEKLHQTVLLNTYTFDIKIKMITRDGRSCPEYIVNRVSRKTESPYRTIHTIKQLAKDIEDSN